jgi:N-formylglutamate deformylase
MIFHIPHSSKKIPENICPLLLTGDDLRQELIMMTDAYVDELFAGCATADDMSLVFPISRLVVDVERFADDCKESMARVGMGVIYTRTSKGNLLRYALTVAEREKLLTTYYTPHHERLTKAVNQELQRDSSALIMDCHSFSSIPLQHEPVQELKRPEICIGTDEVHTPQALCEVAVTAAKERGFDVAVNTPFGGALFPQRYQNDIRVQSIMIEVNRKLYMNEETGEKTFPFRALQEHLGCITETIRQYTIYG